MPLAASFPQNRMKLKMQSGEVALGMILRVVRGVEVAAIAQSAGFDCIYIDLEHCSFSLETVSQLSIAATAMGITPIVRVPSLDSAFVGRTLETGAQGIIVPQLETPEEAEALVRAAKFPPRGNRSWLSINPHLQYRAAPAVEAMQAINDATLVVVMIESTTGVSNADKIAAVEGIDMLLVGTNDLCNSLGVPGQFDHDDVRHAYTVVADACRQHGKILGVGGLNSRPDLARGFVEMGARYISAGSDAGYLMSAASAAVKAFR